MYGNRIWVFSLLSIVKSTAKEAQHEYTITQKMADQERFDFDVVLTMILCAANFSIW